MGNIFDEAQQINEPPRLKEREILDLRSAANRELIRNMGAIRFIPNDYREMVAPFVSEVLQRIPQGGPVLYCSISLQPDFTAQILSYEYYGQRFYRVAVNVLVLEFAKSDLESAGSLDRLPGFKTLGATLSKDNPLDAVARDVSNVIGRMNDYLRGEGVSALSRNVVS